MRVMIVKPNEALFKGFGVKIFITLTKNTSYFVVSDTKFQDICKQITESGNNIHTLMSW